MTLTNSPASYPLFRGRKPNVLVALADKMGLVMGDRRWEDNTTRRRRWKSLCCGKSISYYLCAWATPPDKEICFEEMAGKVKDKEYRNTSNEMKMRFSFLYFYLKRIFIATLKYVYSPLYVQYKHYNLQKANTFPTNH